MTFIPAIAEFIGTFIFISVILHTTNLGNLQPIAVGIGLIASLYFVSSISGGHLNPAITITKWLGEKSIQSNQALIHIGAQILGGLSAWWFYKVTKSN
jgi:glycerol uptake facilitator-like aquaporin